MRRDTTSQFAFTLSTASAETMSLPAPQSTESVPPKAACTRSLPAPVTMRSGFGVPTIASPAFVPRIVAAVALDAKTRKSKKRALRRMGGRSEYPRRMSALDVDVLVIGSGFGGSVAALRLTEKGHRVAVLEAGSRFAPGDFARTNWNLRRYLFMPRLGLRGIQRLTVLDDLVVLSGAGVGGGSLVYANTLYEPLDPFFEDPQWSAVT